MSDFYPYSAEYKVPHIPLCKRQEGFTLLEIILSLILLGIVASIGGMGIVAAIESHEFSRANVHISQKAQVAMVRITRELMELTDVIDATDDSGTPGINRFIIYERLMAGNNQSAVRFGLHYYPGDSHIRLYTDLDGGVTQLDESTIGQGDKLIDQVNDLNIELLKGEDAWSPGTDDIDLLSTIRVTMVLKRPDDPYKDQTFSTVVHMRNTNNFGGAAPSNNPPSKNDYSCFISVIQQESHR